ncbi:hypothetical protein MHTCC0001_20550 [Flavobacteriaceae bacterium MHTCC 0001]
MALCLSLFFELYAQTVDVTSGTLRKWDRVAVELTLPGNDLNESNNTFRNSRMDVVFTRPNGSTIRVPGFFAADGNAANTNATSGKKFRAYLRPDAIGSWSYRVLYYTGNNVAVQAVNNLPAPVHDLTGTVGNILNTNATLPDLRAKGRLRYQTSGNNNARRYLRFTETGEYFLKFGPDSPENFLDFNEFDFDDSRNNCNLCFQHSFGGHSGDFNNGDPTWDGGKGENIIGAINYLSEIAQVNSISMSLFGGDDKNVFPWTLVGSKFIYDVSKLEQWEIVLNHAEQKGLMLHFKLAEAENWFALNTDEINTYYREMVARFGHHLALEWNISEEYGSVNTTASANAASAVPRINFLDGIDPWNNHIVIHTRPEDQYKEKYDQFLAQNPKTKLTGASMQNRAQNNWAEVYDLTIRLINASKNNNTPWVVASDEQAPANNGIFTNTDINNTTVNQNIRKGVLWGNLIAGGAGVMWYGGSNGDFRTEDYRRYNTADTWARHAITTFFKGQNIPFWEMENNDNLISGNNNHCLAKVGEQYIVYLPNGGNHNLNLNGQTGDFEVKWFDPRNGGNLTNGNTLTGGGDRALGNPPNTTGNDWVVLVTNTNGGTIVDVTGISVSPTSTSIEVGTSATITATVSPNNATNKSVNWSTSDSNIATVSNGVVTGISTGTATITATSVDGNFTASSTITVTPSTGTTSNLNAVQDAYLQGSTSFNNTDLRIESGNRVSYLMFDLSSISGSITNAELSLSVSNDAGNGQVNIALGNSNNWTESNLSTSNAPTSGGQLGTLNATYSIGQTYTWNLDESSINGGGMLSLIVTHVSGNDISFASDENTNASLRPVLKITTSSGGNNIPVTGVSVSPTAPTLTSVGATIDLTATVSPSNATNNEVSWSSSNTSVATVSASGLVTAVANGSTNITVTTNDGGFQATSVVTVSTSTSNCGADFEEVNGLVVIEAENMNNVSTTQWTPKTNVAGFTGASYLSWDGSNNFATPGTGLITATIRINDPGEYRFQWRSKVGLGTSSTEHNDSWLRFPDADDFFGRKPAGSVVYPTGSGKTPNPAGSGADGWFKIYLSGTTDWTWNTATSDNDAHQIYVQFDNPGTYTIEISGRSKDHLIDRIVMFKNSVANPTALTQTETPCTGGNINVTGVSVTPTATTLTSVGATIDLTATVSPSNATNKGVSWSSSNTSVATVNSSGLVTAVANGSTTITVTTNDGAFTATSIVTVNITTSTGQTPFGGTARAIPGTINSVDFDNGGQGVAYNDTTSGNNGSGARQDTDVDTENRTAGGNVGWIATGEWLEYTVNVANAGTYTIDVQVASTGNNGAYHIEFNGTDVTGVQSVNSTGGWGTFVNQTISNVSLSAGEQVMRVFMDGGSFNLAAIVFSTEAVVAPVTTTLSPIQDAYIQGSSNINNTLLRVESGNRTGYLMFDLSSINGTITAAQLNLTCSGDNGNGNINIDLGGSSNWTETTLTTANAPTSSALLGNLNSTYSIGNSYSWDLMHSSINGGGNVSLIVTQTSGNDVAFASKENTTATEPQLVITYNPSSAKTAYGKTNKEVIANYANPYVRSNGDFKVNILGDSKAQIQIFNISGALVFKASNVIGEKIIPKNYFKATGLYIIRINTAKDNVTSKLVVD